MTVPAATPPRDLLARTYLQLEGTVTDSAAADLAKTLRRIPGVLLADVHASGRVSIAHDEAVETQSFIAGAQTAGFAVAVIDTGARSVRSDVDAARSERQHKRRALNIGVALFVAIAVPAAFLPHASDKQWLLAGLVVLVWTVYFTTRQARGPRG